MKQNLTKKRASLYKLPDCKDAAAVQKFLLEEIQLAEVLFTQGKQERSTTQLTNALAAGGQPQQMLELLQQVIPIPVFQMSLPSFQPLARKL